MGIKIDFEQLGLQLALHGENLFVYTSSVMFDDYRRGSKLFYIMGIRVQCISLGVSELGSLTCLGMALPVHGTSIYSMI